ncbi:MAG TPA: APC family permease [Candidatus Binataceae bacterium]|nr:APC family permease [Candidatus Binataceae bacterium]
MEPPVASTSITSAQSRPTTLRLQLMPLICVMFLVVSGGAYGLEDSVRSAGPRMTMLLCIVVPLTLSLPTALMAAELTALMPVEGGFYFWVKDALGPFAGFAEAYLTILYTAVDMAIYPTLFATYLSFLLPIGWVAKIVAGIAVVWLSGLLNIFGIRPVGRASIVLAAVVMLPFVALVIAGYRNLVHFQMPSPPFWGDDPAGALAAGLTVVIWNFSGWENLSVVAGEIEEPQRNYPRAIAVALPVIVMGYLLPLAVAVSGAKSASDWRTGWFSHEGLRIGGPMLGAALAIGGTVMSFAVFEAAMLWVSRMPFVLARERYLPRPLAELWSARATPGKSIVLCCVVFTLLVPVGFYDLVILDVFFYMAALVLEMAALVRLRRMVPDRDGRFTIGGGRVGLMLTALLPIVTWLATFGFAVSTGGAQEVFMLAIALTACVWPVYALCRRRYGGPVDSGSV